MPETLSYSSGRTAPGYGLLKLALGLGISPMVCGIAIALLFVATEWERLKVAGFFCIMGGGMLVLIGMGLLAVYAVDHIRFGLRARGSVLHDVVLVLLAFALNLPATLLSLRIVRPTMARYELTITNGLPTTADRVDITVSSIGTTSVGPLAPGTTIKRQWRLAGHHEVSIRTRAAGATGDQIIDYSADAEFGPYKRFWTITPAATQPSDASLR